MTKRERAPLGQRLIASMSEGLNKIRDEKPLRTSYVTVPPAPPEFRREDLLALRRRLNMTQMAMAAFVNVSEKTLESWEQGSRSPNGAALRLLQVIDQPAILAEVSGTKGRPQEPARPRRERILMALLLELVRVKPGLPEDQYNDALVDATRMRQHQEALSGEERDTLVELLPKIPKKLFIGKSKQTSSYLPLVNGLEQMGYLKVEQKRGARALKRTSQKIAPEHSWLAWPAPGFAELVWVASMLGLERKSHLRETVEV